MPGQILSDLSLSIPLLVTAAGALLLMIFDVFAASPWPRGAFCAVVLSIALCLLIDSPLGREQVIFGGLLYAGPYTRFAAVVICAGALLAVMLSLNKQAVEGVEREGEYYALLLMSVAGAYILLAAAELITLFVGLEIMSISLYPLCAAAPGRRRAVEAGIKYFLVGSFASAILLYGIALLYGAAHSTAIAGIATAAAEGGNPLFYTGAALFFCGIIFKAGLVPFHFWVPDVYHGAPTAVSAFMAAAVKAAVLAAAFRIFWVLFGADQELWSNLVWWAATLSMLIGNLAALAQRSFKRMLAYSSIAHGGYIFMGLLARSEVASGGAAALYYLLIYTFMTVGAFAGALLISAAYADKKNPDDITRFNGLAGKCPWSAGLIAFFMLALAGIPPAIGGFMAKFFVFSAVIQAGRIGIVLIACLSALIGVYYYLRVVVAMYFAHSTEEPRPLENDLALYTVLFLCAAAVLALGMFPAGVYARAAAAVAGL